MGNLMQFPEATQMTTEWQGFYSSAQVSRLAGVPLTTLYEWKRRGIIRPSLQLVQEGLVADEGFSYADLSMIRIIKALRDKKLSFDRAGNALSHLYERLGPPSEGWANERVYVFGNTIYADRRDDWGATDATLLGQTVSEVFFGDLLDELRGLDEGASIIVPPQFRQYIEVNPNVMGGEPVLRNTRVPTATLVMMLLKYKSMDKLYALYRPISEQTIGKGVEYERYLDERIA